MPYRVTCPHCETALRVADAVWASTVTCPHCLGRIPNPGPVAGGMARGQVMAISVDDEARRDSRGTGCGVLVLASLVAVGIAFVLSLGLSVTGQSGRYGDNLFLVWFGVGGLGALLVMGLTTYYMTRSLAPRLADDPHGSAGGRRFMQVVAVCCALFTGLLAGLVVFGLTCGAILGGAGLGGG